MATLQNTLCMEMMKVRGSFYCHRIIFLVFTYPAIPYILYIPSANSLLCTMMCYIQADPNFQMVFGYDVDEPNEANYAICSNQITERYNCLAVTLEMPYKVCTFVLLHYVYHKADH